MATNAIQPSSPKVTQIEASILETVLIKGDLGKLTEQQRLSYYTRLCETVGLNPLTQPFQYLVLNGRLTLYARKDCTDQLRSIHGVSVTNLEHKSEGGLFIVTAKVRDRNDRTDAAIGATNIENLKGEAKANAMMKAETKAKRRATLSICGLGMLDETEIDSIPGAMPVEAVAKDGKVTIQCEECNKPINPVSVDGRDFTIQQVMNNSRKHWDLDLCGDCQQKRVKAAETPTVETPPKKTRKGKQTDFDPKEFEVSDQEIAELHNESQSPELTFK